MRDIQQGGLRQKFDAIIFADQTANSMENGFAPDSMPKEYVGGLGSNGRGGAEGIRHAAAAWCS